MGCLERDFYARSGSFYKPIDRRDMARIQPMVMGVPSLPDPTNLCELDLNRLFKNDAGGSPDWELLPEGTATTGRIKGAGSSWSSKLTQITFSRGVRDIGLWYDAYGPVSPFTGQARVRRMRRRGRPAAALPGPRRSGRRLGRPPCASGPSGRRPHPLRVIHRRRAARTRCWASAPRRYCARRRGGAEPAGLKRRRPRSSAPRPRGAPPVSAAFAGR